MKRRVKGNTIRTWTGSQHVPNTASQLVYVFIYTVDLHKHSLIMLFADLEAERHLNRFIVCFKYLKQF